MNFLTTLWTLDWLLSDSNLIPVSVSRPLRQTHTGSPTLQLGGDAADNINLIRVREVLLRLSGRGVITSSPSALIRVLTRERRETELLLITGSCTVTPRIMMMIPVITCCALTQPGVTAITL